MFLGSCYSGQTRSGETLIASARPVALKAEKQLFPENFTVITASQADQISSSSSELKHGIFSFYLMRGIEGDADANHDGKITAGEMQDHLTRWMWQFNHERPNKAWGGITPNQRLAMAA